MKCAKKGTQEGRGREIKGERKEGEGGRREEGGRGRDGIPIHRSLDLASLMERKTQNSEVLMLRVIRVLCALAEASWGK